MPMQFLGALGLLLCSGLGLAEVTLTTSVTKVETTLDPAGRVKRQLVPADEVLPGEELRYAITFTNTSETLVDAGRIIITNPIPEAARYVAGSAGGLHARLEFSQDGEAFANVEPASADADGAATLGARANDGAAGLGASAGPGASTGEVRALRWTYEADLAPGESGEVFFHVRMR
jgi:uncharacterized repeat protein (TIGR01451 family)